MENSLTKPFVVTSITRSDLIGLERVNQKTGEITLVFNEEDVLSLTDAYMERLASKLENDYCEQLFWTSLEIIGASVIEQSKEK